MKKTSEGIMKRLSASRAWIMGALLMAAGCEPAMDDENEASFPLTTPPACAKMSCANYWGWINYQHCKGATFNATTCSWSGYTSCTANSGCGTGQVCDKSDKCCVANTLCQPKPSSGNQYRWVQKKCPDDRSGCTKAYGDKLGQGDYTWFGGKSSLTCDNWDSTMCVWKDQMLSNYCLFRYTIGVGSCSSPCSGGARPYEGGGTNCNDLQVLQCSVGSAGLSPDQVTNCGCPT
jgi:hypothetical protein